MKKVTFLTCVLALCTSTMFAQTLEVTTADMDPVAAGGLVYVIEHAESGSVIEFNFDGEVLDYGEGTGIAIKGKTLTFNGINKKNGKRVTIKGLESLFTVGEASVISLNDLIIDGFKNIGWIDRYIGNGSCKRFAFDSARETKSFAHDYMGNRRDDCRCVAAGVSSHCHGYRRQRH